MAKIGTMQKSPWLVVLTAGTLLMAGSSIVSAAQFDKVIKERHQLMEGISAASKAMRSAADAETVAANADKLAAAFARINADTFPKGSSDGSHAKPEIWERWEEFTAKAANGVTLAQAIAAKARAGESTAELVKSFGKNACGSCHRPFRKPKSKS